MTEARTTEPGSIREWLVQGLTDAESKANVPTPENDCDPEGWHVVGVRDGLAEAYRIFLAELDRREAAPPITLDGPDSADDFDEIVCEILGDIDFAWRTGDEETIMAARQHARHYLVKSYRSAISEVIRREAAPTITLDGLMERISDDRISGFGLDIWITKGRMFGYMPIEYDASVTIAAGDAGGIGRSETAKTMKHALIKALTVTLAAVESDLGTRAQTDAGGDENG